MWIYVLLGLVLGGGTGLILGFFWASRRCQAVRLALENERDELRKKLEDLEQQRDELKTQCTELKARLEAAVEKNQWLNQAQETLKETFQALASSALNQNAQQLLAQAKEAIGSLLNEVKGDWGKSATEIQSAIKPLKDALDKLEAQVRELESKRESAYGSLTQHLKQIAENHEKLANLTGQLSQALKSPTARGRWGEMQLRRIVEMAGLQKHIDFEEQVGTDSGRPDLIVYLPNVGMLAVDAKVPMDAFLKALETNNEGERRGHAQEHAQSLLRHVRELGKRRYWESLGKAPDLVIMFVPSESCVATAFEVEPGLFEESWKNNVVIATPTLLFALLKTVAWGWQQHEMAEQAQTIARDALELFKRFASFSEQFKKIGDKLDQAVDAYNDAAAAAREKLLPLARRYSERLSREFPEPPTLHSPAPFNTTGLIRENNAKSARLPDGQ